MTNKRKAKKKKQKKKETKIGTAVELKYLSLKFKIPLKKLEKKWINLTICSIDAFIIATTISLIANVTKIIPLQMIIGLITVFSLIYVIYEIFGKILILKGYDKDEL